MVISSSTLESWASIENAATTSAQRTHNKIQDELNSSSVFPDDVEFDTFLQGSYANHTIVRTSSDVDVVACLTSFQYEDPQDLKGEQRAMWKRHIADQTVNYSWHRFRTHIIEALEDRFGADAVTEGDKTLKLDSSALLLDADVLVATRYVRFYNFPNGYYRGVTFWDSSNNQIVNYPRRHIDYGSKKNQSTNSRFKETVRIFKRARNYLVDDGQIKKENVPSYFIENLLYNVPDGRYVYDKQDRYYKVVEYLSQVDYHDWACQNGITPMFGTGSTKWSTLYADRYVDALATLWDD